MTIVPVPGAKPAAPYWIFHCVSVPPAVQAKSALLVVMLLAVKAVGGKHAGQFPATDVSTFTTPAAIIAPPPSKISQLISPGHEPGTQLEVEIISPVPALKRYSVERPCTGSSC